MRLALTNVWYGSCLADSCRVSWTTAELSQYVIYGGLDKIISFNWPYRLKASLLRVQKRIADIKAGKNMLGVNSLRRRASAVIV